MGPRPIHNKNTVESRYSTILQPTQVSMGMSLNLRDHRHFEEAAIEYCIYVRGAVVSGNMFKRILMAY